MLQLLHSTYVVQKVDYFAKKDIDENLNYIENSL